ncbi:MAG: sulfate transporter permease [Phycisphaerales bacterium]|jgi:sulfate transport system permease protein|nr:sulfate transporter permease [Phycisphaerales bacterium]
MRSPFKQRRVVPGFGLSLGCTVLYLGVIVLIPLSALFFKSARLTWPQFKTVVSSDAVMAAYTLSFEAALVAALVNLPLGLLVAWVLARYRFPGRRFLDAMIDLPFALPTAVAGITLTTIYSDSGWIGRWLDTVHFHAPWLMWRGFDGNWWPFEVQQFTAISYTPIGVALALVFIGLPFVVRTVQPVLQDMGLDVEEAAASLGASRWQTLRRVVLPELRPALLSGFALAFARALGEYGSVVFISGNTPLQTEIAPIKVVQELEQNHYAEATSIAIVILMASFFVLLTVNLLQRHYSRRGMA